MLYDQKDGTSNHQSLSSKFLSENVMTPSKAFLPSQIGAVGISNNPDEAITGFDADLLVGVMAKANLPNYVLQVTYVLSLSFDPPHVVSSANFFSFSLPVLTRSYPFLPVLTLLFQFYSYYATPILHLRTGECDVAFGEFSQNSFRQHCNNISSVSSESPCLALPTTESDLIKIPGSDLASYACCASVGSPIFPSSIGILIGTKTDAPSLASFLFQPDVINIISLVALAIIIAGHFVWILERHHNSDQFPTAYLDGIDDAIWWASTTVTTVGYGDKSPVTSGGRIVGLVWQFAGVVFLGLFAGTLSASMSRVAMETGVNRIRDLTPSHRVCTENIYVDLLKSYPFSSYVATYQECIDNLKAGTADAVMYDDNFLRHEFVIDPTMTAKFKVIPGDNIKFNGPYFPSAPKDSTVALRMNSAMTSLRADTVKFDSNVKLYVILIFLLLLLFPPLNNVTSCHSLVFFFFFLLSSLYI